MEETSGDILFVKLIISSTDFIFNSLKIDSFSFSVAQLIIISVK